MARTMVSFDLVFISFEKIDFTFNKGNKFLILEW